MSFPELRVSNWKWPNVEGLDQYTGKLIHSADWDESYNFRGKKVAVIGIGSSAIQIIPKLANGMNVPMRQLNSKLILMELAIAP
jgi:cation diffusion facilitator CzcD-associated flavoprotein CzcO